MSKFLCRLFCSLLMVILFACGAMAAEVRLAVAASLREVVVQLSDAFAKKNPGVTFQSSFGASGALARQIENGAPCDVFFSANVEWVDYLKGKKLVDPRHVSIFAYNELVFVGRPDLKATGLKDLPGLDKIAMGSPKSVPAGQYAEEAVRKAGLTKQLEKKLVMARDVRECLMYAERGEVDGSFVYKTDAEQMAKNVKILFVVPQDLYPRVTYPMALTVTGSRKPEAEAFYRFLQSAEAKTTLAGRGFIIK